MGVKQKSQETLDSSILFVFFLRNQFAKMINIFAKFWYKTNRYLSIVIVQRRTSEMKFGLILILSLTVVWATAVELEDIADVKRG